MKKSNVQSMKKKGAKGGERKGAGRKPAENPKKPITVYFDQKTIDSYGGVKAIKELIYKIHPSAEPPHASLAPKIKDLTKPTNSLKPQDFPKSNFSINTIPEQKEAPAEAQAFDNAEIFKQIAEIEAEKIPKERDTPMGKKAWLIDQSKRIKELQKQLK